MQRRRLGPSGGSCAGVSARDWGEGVDGRLGVVHAGTAEEETRASADRAGGTDGAAESLSGGKLGVERCNGLGFFVGRTADDEDDDILVPAAWT